jgi:putative phosphonate metabolism protein
MTERFAIYYAPATDDPLWARASQWLGRDAARNGPPIAAIPDIDTDRRQEVTVSARRYGFHATLKPPMALAHDVGERDLLDAMADFATRRAPVAIGRLRLGILDGFLALMPQVQGGDLTDLAGDIVTLLDRFRAPLAAGERERRMAAGLTGRQAELLDTYGYPYVLEHFRFHMTLTDRLVDIDRDAIAAAAEAWFEPVLDRTYQLDRLVLFHEAGPGEPFMRRAEVVLGTMVAADA